MSEAYICDECEVVIGKLQTFIIQVENISGIEAHGISFHNHFCSFVCLSKWTESRIDQYEVTNG